MAASVETSLRSLLEGRRGGLVSLLLRGLLSPLGLIYGGLMWLRRKGYERGIFTSTALPVPVICVGNITAGGTGKTPFTLHLVQALCERGEHPAILCRGYGAENPEAADEVLLYRQRCPAIPVFAGADRIAAGRRAIAAGATILVMDDGFQHLRLQRDGDIILMDATCPFGGGLPLPAGLLREFPGALEQADLIVLTHSDEAEPPDGLERFGPLIATSHRPCSLVDGEGTAHSLEALTNLQVCALSGIGRPEAFASTLRACGATVAHRFDFADHHTYRTDEIQTALAYCHDKGLQLVTTEKDAVKLLPLLSAEDKASFWVLGITLTLNHPEILENFLQALSDRKK